MSAPVQRTPDRAPTEPLKDLGGPADAPTPDAPSSPGGDAGGRSPRSGSGPSASGSSSGKGFKATLADTPILPVALLIIGAYLAWFGVHYWRSGVKWPSDPIKALLQGTDVAGAGAVAGATDAAVIDQAEAAKFAAAVDGEKSAGVQTGASTGGTTGSAIANDGLKYVGAGYVFGGNASAVGKWDCSSFVSYVLGHDLGLPLPGGKWGDPGFPPHSHGPTTGTYLLYGTAITRSQLQAGDLVVWATHMGIAISSTEIVAARTTNTGTGTSKIDGVTTELGEIAHYRRVAQPTGVLV